VAIGECELAMFRNQQAGACVFCPQYEFSDRRYATANIDVH